MKLVSNTSNNVNKVFAVINTTAYNEDNNYSIKVVELEENDTNLLGYEVDEEYINVKTNNIIKIENMMVNDIIIGEIGVYMIRIA